MRTKIVIIVFFCISGLLFAQDYSLDDFVIKFEDGTEVEITYQDEIVHFGIPSVDALNQQYGVTDAEKIFYDESGNTYAMWYVLYLAESDSDIVDIVAAYQDDANIAFSEPDFYTTPLTEDEFIPNDHLFSLEQHPNPDPYPTSIRYDQWALRNDGD
ncbi:MAG: hypothetical protein GWN00_32265, partial [Aliifodinibius sp.]|nr:hypothetical protein [Fodinibius sp.]NIV15445.1 hypothetical protein [Fodinibius sp.]NIY29294.1 hypothetical protein [Fodinibius sp.]